MRCPAGACDDDFEPPLLSGSSILDAKVRSAVTGDNPDFVWDPEGLQYVYGPAHGIPVGPGAHHHAYEWL
jgi:hypothetical protein